MRLKCSAQRKQITKITSTNLTSVRYNSSTFSESDVLMTGNDDNRMVVKEQRNDAHLEHTIEAMKDILGPENWFKTEDRSGLEGTTSDPPNRTIPRQLAQGKVFVGHWKHHISTAADMRELWATIQDAGSKHWTVHIFDSKDNCMKLADSLDKNMYFEPCFVGLYDHNSRAEDYFPQWKASFSNAVYLALIDGGYLDIASVTLHQCGTTSLMKRILAENLEANRIRRRRVTSDRRGPDEGDGPGAYDRLALTPAPTGSLSPPTRGSDHDYPRPGLFTAQRQSLHIPSISTITYEQDSSRETSPLSKRQRLSTVNSVDPSIANRADFTETPPLDKSYRELCRLQDQEYERVLVENASLREQIQRQEEESSQRVDGLESDLTASRHDVGSTEQRYSNIEAQLDTAVQAKLQFAQTLAGVEADNVALSEQLTAQIEELGTIGDERDVARMQLETSQAEVENLTSKNEFLSDQAKNSKKEMDLISPKNKELTRLLKAAQRAKKEEEGRAKDSQAEAEHLKQKITEMNEKLSHYMGTCENLMAEKLAIEAQLGVLQEDNQQHQKTIADLRRYKLAVVKKAQPILLKMMHLEFISKDSSTEEALNWAESGFAKRFGFELVKNGSSVSRGGQ